jgi:hypothetical protein
VAENMFRRFAAVLKSSTHVLESRAAQLIKLWKISAENEKTQCFEMESMYNDVFHQTRGSCMVANDVLGNKWHMPYLIVIFVAAGCIIVGIYNSVTRESTRFTEEYVRGFFNTSTAHVLTNGEVVESVPITNQHAPR